MQNRDLYELIESYLNGELPDKQRQQVEQRMAADAAFREEVELHRALQEDYADPARWRLREALSDIMSESPPPGSSEESPPNRRRPLWAAVPVVLLLAGGIWYFTRPPAPIPALSPTKHLPETPPAKTQTPEAPPPNTPIQRKQPSAPIARADPDRFKENTGKEALFGRFRSESELHLDMSAPQNAAVFHPDDKGQTRLRFAGTLTGLEPGKTLSLNLLIFNNRDAASLLTLPIQITLDAKATAVFDLRKTASLPKGLYYYCVEQQESGDWLTVGKFFIGRL